MRNKLNILILVLLSILLSNNWAVGQTYFKSLIDSDKYFNQKINRFPNGDILIGDSSLESLRNGRDGKIILTRLDNCGIEKWSYEYVFPEGYLEVKDFEINEQEEIFAYGSYFRELEELVFLTKIDGKTGKNLDFRLYLPSTIDHFSYTLDLKDGNLMLYGLLLDFNTKKQGFVAVFNENLGFKWAKKFAPFESTGEAKIDKDGGIIGRSGDFLIKLNKSGDFEWASELEGGDNIQVVSGPIEVADGYLFEAHQNGLSWFYKIDDSGKLIWKSHQFPASIYGSAMTKLSNQEVLCTYYRPIADSNTLCQLKLSSTGEISNQNQLLFDFFINPGNLGQSIAENNTVTIVGNANPFTLKPEDVKDFVFQYSLDLLSNECVVLEQFTETIPNQVPLVVAPYTFIPESFEMELISSTKLTAINTAWPLVDLCEEAINPNLLEQDTLLSCEEDWLVNLPSDEFIWLDNIEEQPRLLNQPGIYQARKLSCTDPVVITYTLEKNNCGCSTYLPNSFSPNQDGLNDQLEFFSDCEISKLEMKIFNRWGEQVFHSQSTNHFWDGIFQKRDAISGSYLAIVDYEWTDFDGILQQHRFYQEISLIR